MNDDTARKLPPGHMAWTRSATMHHNTTVSLEPRTGERYGLKFAVIGPAVPAGILQGLVVVPSQGPPVQPVKTLPAQGYAVTVMSVPNAPNPKTVGNDEGVVLPQPVTPIVVPYNVMGCV